MLPSDSALMSVVRAAGLTDVIKPGQYQGWTARFQCASAQPGRAPSATPRLLSLTMEGGSQCIPSFLHLKTSHPQTSQCIPLENKMQGESRDDVWLPAAETNSEAAKLCHCPMPFRVERFCTPCSKVIYTLSNVFFFFLGRGGLLPLGRLCQQLHTAPSCTYPARLCFDLKSPPTPMSITPLPTYRSMRSECSGQAPVCPQFFPLSPFHLLFPSPCSISLISSPPTLIHAFPDTFHHCHVLPARP